MGALIRLIIIGALIWLAWRLIRSTLLENQQSPSSSSRPSGGGSQGTPERMVRCDQCGVHVPESEAFFHKQHAFCSQDHQRVYLEHHRD